MHVATATASKRFTVVNDAAPSSSPCGAPRYGRVVGGYEVEKEHHESSDDNAAPAATAMNRLIG